MKILEKILVLIFGTHSDIATIIISMFPIIELKGAIPIGMSADLWGVHSLSGEKAFILSLIGSSIVVPMIALTFTPLLKWFSSTKFFKNTATVINEKVNKHSNKIEAQSLSSNKKPRTWLRCLLLFLFVAVPLPLTGVWTGTCVGVVMGLKLWQILLFVITGNIIAGLIIYFVLAIFPAITTILALIFLAIAIIVMAYLFYKIFLQRKKNSE